MEHGQSVSGKHVGVSEIQGNLFTGLCPASWHRFQLETSIRVELGGRLKILAIRHALDSVQLLAPPFILENPGNLETTGLIEITDEITRGL